MISEIIVIVKSHDHDITQLWHHMTMRSHDMDTNDWQVSKAIKNLYIVRPHLHRCGNDVMQYGAENVVTIGNEH